MDEFFKAVRHFIQRDLVYLVAGGAVLTAFLHRFGRLPSPQDHAVVFLLLAGIGYVTAYALQELFCLLGVVTTTMPRRLNWLTERLYNRYNRFTQKAWKPIEEDVDLEGREYALENKRRIVQFERIITFIQVGTTGFPCALLSGGLLLWRWIDSREPFDLAVALGAFSLSGVLWGLAWIKAAQQSKFLERL